MSSTKTKKFFISLTKYLDILSLLSCVIALAIIQSNISDINTQREGGAVRLQNWMTVFLCLNSFLCVNEINDSFLRKTLLPEDQREPPQNQRDYQDEEIDCTASQCAYHLLFCGIFRNCLIRDELPHEHYPRRKFTRCGVVFFTILTLAFASVVFTSQFEFFSLTFTRFKPHYASDNALSATIKAQVKQYNLIRSCILIYLVVPGILLRVTKFIMGALVLTVLWPVLLAHYFFIKHELSLKQE